MKRAGITKPGEELRRARSQGFGYLGVAFLFSIFVNLLMLTGPLFMLQVYDRVLGSRSEETLVALTILLTLLFFLMGVLDYARGRVVARFGARFQSQLDRRVFEASMKQALNPKARSAPATALQDLQAIQGLCASPVLLALMDIPWTPLFLAGIFIFHPLLGWLAVGGGVVLIVIAITNQALTRNKVQQAHSEAARAGAFSEQARQATEVIHAQGMGDDIGERWTMQRQEALKQNIKASDWTGSFTAMTKAMRLYLQSAMLALGAWLVLQNEMTAGAMIAGSILLGRALAPVEQSISQWPMIQRARGAWVSLCRFLDAVPPNAERTALPKPKANLEAVSLTVRPPGAKTPTLRNVSFQLPAGQAMGVIGKSGSGKTTLAKAVLGLWSPVAGKVRLDGAALDQYSTEDLGRHIGYLPQQVTLFSGTVAENIARMSLQPDVEAVIDAAKKANVHSLILGLQDGYDTVLEGNESQLSGGQKQRIALARALYGDPVLLILDEPNSALDAEGSAALNAAVREFKAQGKSVLIMTHRPAAISECDHLLVIEKGRVTRSGQREDVLNAMVQNVSDIRQNIDKASTA